MSRTVTPQELEQIRASVTLIDVRLKDDYEDDLAIIPGAVWRDPEKVGEWANDVAADEELIVYCAHGGSVGGDVVEQLNARNIRARYVEGGLAGWKSAGYHAVSRAPVKRAG